MQNGDISNEVPLRVVVTLDCILNKRPAVKKTLAGLITLHTEEVTYNRVALSLFWRFAQKNNFSMELVGFGYTRKEMKEIMEDLDNLGTNPFNHTNSYPVVADLVGELPYRPELKYVVDIPSRSLRYGARYLDMGRM